MKCLSLKDIETFDLEDFKYNSVNITAFRLVDVESRRAMEVLDHIKKVRQQHTGLELLNGSAILQVSKMTAAFSLSLSLSPSVSCGGTMKKKKKLGKKYVIFFLVQHQTGYCKQTDWFF